jgi:hypothetical protein
MYMTLSFVFFRRGVCLFNQGKAYICGARGLLEVKDMKQTRTKMASAMLAKLKAMQAINLAKSRQGGSGA